MDSFGGWLLRMLTGLATGYVLLVGLAYVFQRQLQYFPDTSPVPLPAGEVYRGLQSVELKTPDGLRLYAWDWPGQHALTLFFFHGNAGHRGHRLGWIRDFHELGYGVFILDYRGYGGSEGSPTEDGLFSDALTALHWLQQARSDQVVYFGESLGCGVAVQLAMRQPPAALILQSGFSSAVDVARRAYPYLPTTLLMKDRFESVWRIPKINRPMLVIHGRRDSIIPVELGRALFQAAGPLGEWYEVPNADHNDLPWAGGGEYLERIDRFLKQHGKF